MSVESKYIKHGITFEVDGIKKHSFHHFGLYLNNSEFDYPEAKTSYVDIPAYNGSIDYTEYGGNVFYKMRKLSFSFTCQDINQMKGIVDNLVNFINGKKCKIYHWRDMRHYYEGRVFVDKYKSSMALGQLTINAEVYPFRLNEFLTCRTFEIYGNTTVLIDYVNMPTKYHVYVQGGMGEMKHKGKVLQEGVYYGNKEQPNFSDDFVLKQGRNELLFEMPTGTPATVSIVYQEGEL